MKFICNQSDLKNHLSLVSRAVPSRPKPPILGNVLVSADDTTGEISLTAFDLSLGICTVFNGDVLEAGEITLPAKLLADIVTRLPEGEITLSFTANSEDNYITTISSVSGRFQIRGMDAEEFPALPKVTEGASMKLPVSSLLEGLSGVLFAASTEEIKQILTGVHLTYNETGALEFAATDGHRLAVVETLLDNEAQQLEFSEDLADFAVTIPARALRELEKILNNYPGTDTIMMKFNDSQLVFSLGKQKITSRKIEGKYPAYRSLLPQKFSRELSLDRKRLIRSLELVSVLAERQSSSVKFTIDPTQSQLSLSVEAQDLGNAEEIMPAEIIGEATEIGFNPKYLMEGLKAIPTQDIKMSLNEWNQPVIFAPLGGFKMTYLVMPVQLQ